MLNPSEIQHENRHSDGVRCCFFQLCTNTSHAAFALGKTESSFNLHAFAFIYVRLFPVLIGHFLRSAESRS